jgi:hypothetical protein
MKWAGMGHVGETGEVHTGFRWGRGELRQRDHLEDLGVDRRIILKRVFKKWDGACTGLIWLTIGTGGEWKW